MKTKKIFHVFVFVVTMLGISQYAQAQESTLNKRIYVQPGVVVRSSNPASYSTILAPLQMTTGYVLGSASLLFRSHSPYSSGSLEWNDINPRDSTIKNIKCLSYIERVPLHHSPYSAYMGLGAGIAQSSLKRYFSYSNSFSHPSLNLVIGKPLIESSTESLYVETGFQYSGAYKFYRTSPNTTNIYTIKFALGYRF
jgi:hypothetical protein